MLLYALSTPAIILCLGHTACVYTTTYMNFRITYDIQFPCGCIETSSKIHGFYLSQLYPCKCSNWDLNYFHCLIVSGKKFPRIVTELSNVIISKEEN